MNMMMSKSELVAALRELLIRLETSNEATFVTNHGRPCIDARAGGRNADALQLLREAIIDYGDVLSPIESDGWHALQ